MGRHARRRELAVGAALGRAEAARRRQVPVQVTFDEPGTYVLRCRADDGALVADEEVTIVVVR